MQFQDLWRNPPKRPLLTDKIRRPLTEEVLIGASRGFILSPSGWRKVFAPDEHSISAVVNAADLQLVALGAYLFAREAADIRPSQPKAIAVAHDSRPTSPALAEAALMGLLAAGADANFLGLLPIPHLVAHVQRQPSLHGFFYITASHNPVGHNGLKFGLGDGRVLHPRLASNLINQFRDCLQDTDRLGSVMGAIARVSAGAVEYAYSQILNRRRQSFVDYAALTSLILFGQESPPAGAFQSAGGIVADMNGSARCVGIDREFLGRLGLKTHFINTKPGKFAHDILPEGASLQDCARELSNRHDFALGYVPDCDGDRGNIVIRTTSAPFTRTLEAQELFALCVVSTLSRLVATGQLTYDEDGFPEQRIGIVVNDPTSLRVDRIAEAFRVPVFRAEVGEANLNALAEQLRQEDWYIPLVGEGSNGGNISFPGTVRDPLSTLGSVLRLLTQPELFQVWCARSGRSEPEPRTYSLEEVIATLPVFRTTPVGSPRAVMQVPPLPQARFKALFETLFITHGWNSQKQYLAEHLDIHGWEEINYEGPEERRGFGPPFRSGKETGGLKILLKNRQGRPKGFLWMRGSGTEPVFRLMVDIEGNDPMHEEYLMNWFTGMLKKIT